MIHSLQRVNPEESILWLSEEQMQEPFTVLEDLCTDFSLGQLRNSLSESLEICLTEDDIFRDAGKRAQLTKPWRDWWRRFLLSCIRGSGGVNELERAKGCA